LGDPYAKIGADIDGRAGIEWGVYGVPETFVIDGAGIVRFKHTGALTPQIIEKQILPLLEGAK
jgi:cytochrome c biogenesis protein CcmG/thiol:disulfide interchange protein DsbE